MVCLSGRMREIDAMRSTGPAYPVEYLIKKGLAVEAFFGIWLPGPARWNSVESKCNA